MELERVDTPDAPAPVGPYAQAVAAGSTVFVSGQIALDPSTGRMVEGDAAAQTRRAMANLRAVLGSLGLGVDALVKVTMFLVSMDDYGSCNAAYEEALGGWTPARSVVEVARLPRGALVEIEAVACR